MLSQVQQESKSSMRVRQQTGVECPCGRDSAAARVREVPRFHSERRKQVRCRLLARMGQSARELIMAPISRTFASRAK
jgi:hypothetical protein